jgi:hypothetical protein
MVNPPHFSCTVPQWLDQFLSRRLIVPRGLEGAAITFFRLHTTRLYRGGLLKYVLCDNWSRSIAALRDNTRKACAVIIPSDAATCATLLMAPYSMCELQAGHQYKHLTVLNVQAFVVFHMHVCGLVDMQLLAQMAQHCKFSLYEYIKKQLFSLLLLFHVVPVSPSLLLPLDWKHIPLSLSCQLGNITINFATVM